MQRVLAAARDSRNGARWAIALALGLRQGEALALRWDDIDLKAKTLRVRATRLRPVYEHGCDGTCGKTAGYCPDRRQRNGPTGATKSSAGNRIVGLPDELVALLESHRRAQIAERLSAGSLWEEGGWVFASRLGRPIIPNTDYLEWKALLQRAGVRHARLHDARHTAATVLLVLGVPERTVMSIMGWSSSGDQPSGQLVDRRSGVVDVLFAVATRVPVGLRGGPAAGRGTHDRRRTRRTRSPPRA